MKLPRLTGSEDQIKLAAEKLEILAASLDNFLSYREAANMPKDAGEKVRGMFEGATFSAADVIAEYPSRLAVMNCGTRAEQIHADLAMCNLVNFVRSKGVTSKIASTDTR